MPDDNGTSPPENRILETLHGVGTEAPLPAAAPAPAAGDVPVESLAAGTAEAPGESPPAAGWNQAVRLGNRAVVDSLFKVADAMSAAMLRKMAAALPPDAAAKILGKVDGPEVHREAVVESVLQVAEKYRLDLRNWPEVICLVSLGAWLYPKIVTLQTIRQLAAPKPKPQAASPPPPAPAGEGTDPQQIRIVKPETTPAQ